MKHILFVTPSLRHGGTNRSLWNFLNTQTKGDYTVDILAMEHYGPYWEKFNQFNLLPKNKLLASLFPFTDATGVNRLVEIYHKLLFKTIFFGNRRRLLRAVAQHFDSEKYDVVVAFQEGLASEFVSYLPAKKRIAWVRCDYSNYLRLAKRSDESAIYDRFDHIVCVSKYTAGVFSSHYPHLNDRVHSIYNIIDTAGIIETAKHPITDRRFITDKFTFISVGRMDAVKRFAYIPRIARHLKDNGCDFRWYIIGSGGTEETRVQQAIADCGVEEQVILLGSKNNPYPYIAAANILVCPSRTEACPNVINEAKILHVPVVAADFPSAAEFIEHGINGEIVSIDLIAESLFRLYTDAAYYQELKDGISSFAYDNTVIHRQLDNLLT